MSSYVIDMRREFHKIPELGFEEYKTSQRIQEELQKIGVEYTTGIAGTGIIVSMGAGHPHIAFRAEIDGLPIQEENETSYKSLHEGCMHACGHDSHIAAMLDTIKYAKDYFMRNEIEGKVTFIFQPCEESANSEGFSGGRIISSLPELSDVDSFYAAHIESTLESGKVFIRDGALTAAIDRFDIDVIGKAGHGAYPHLALDPIWLATNAMVAINSLEAKVANTAHPSVITICSVHGGKIWNAIPDSVNLSGTIRTFNQEEREKIHNNLEKCLETVDVFGGKHKLTITKGNPSVINDKKESDFVRNIVSQYISPESVSDIEIQMGGDDFTYYSTTKPSCYFYVGAKKDNIARPHHSGLFDIDESKIEYISTIFKGIIRGKLKCR